MDISTGWLKFNIHTWIYPWMYPWISISTASLQFSGEKTRTFQGLLSNFSGPIPAIFYDLMELR